MPVHSTTVLLVQEKDLSDKPSVTKRYASRWLKVSSKTIYDWIDAKKITLDENGDVPFSELIRLDKA